MEQTEKLLLKWLKLSSIHPISSLVFLSGFRYIGMMHWTLFKQIDNTFSLLS